MTRATNLVDVLELKVQALPIFFDALEIAHLAGHEFDTVAPHMHASRERIKLPKLRLRDMKVR